VIIHMYWVGLSRFKSITSQNPPQSHPIHSNTHVISITEQGLSGKTSLSKPPQYTRELRPPFLPRRKSRRNRSISTCKEARPPKPPQYTREPWLPSSPHHKSSEKISVSTWRGYPIKVNLEGIIENICYKVFK
jgi:hypothetical protein